MQRKKIDLQKVLEALNTLCPACGFTISPDKIRRVNTTHIECPKCGKVFDAQKPVNPSI